MTILREMRELKAAIASAETLLFEFVTGAEADGTVAGVAAARCDDAFHVMFCKASNARNAARTLIEDKSWATARRLKDSS